MSNQFYCNHSHKGQNHNKPYLEGLMGVQKFSRQKKLTNSTDYVVYLQEFDFHIVYQTELSTLSQAIRGVIFTLSYNAMRE